MNSLKYLGLAALLAISPQVYSKPSYQPLEIRAQSDVSTSTNLPFLYQSAKDATPETLQSLQERFKRSFVTDGVVEYKPLSLDAVVSYKDSKSSVRLPAYFGGSVRYALTNVDGVKYLRALFNTNDSALDMLNNIQRLTGHNVNNISLWSLMSSERKTQPSAAITVSYDGQLHIHATRSPKK